MRFLSRLDWMLFALAVGSLGLTAASYRHLPYYTFMMSASDCVDVSLYQGSLCVAALQHSGIGVGPEPGWRWHHFVNTTAPSKQVWLEYGGYLEEMQMLGWGRIYRIPLLPITALLIVPTALHVLGARLRRGRGGCATCGYDLTGNISGRCPECGTSISRLPERSM
jgi:hypothetical protein